MAKVFQIVNDMCYWLTPYNSVEETVGRYPADCKFVEAPDKVNEHWGYREFDDEGNPLEGDDRFIVPTPPEGWLYDEETGTFYPESDVPVRLERAKEAIQNYNKAMLSEFLNAHPLTYTDGKQYGVTMEDQTEMQLNISQYQIQVAAGVENPILEWHPIHEACTSRTLEEMSTLALAISAFVYPYFRLMQDYKVQIYACETIAEVEAMQSKIVYKTIEELAAEEAAKASVINPVVEETVEEEVAEEATEESAE